MWARAVRARRELGPRPTGPEDPALDELAALLESGLARRSFPDELMRELRRAGLHVDPEALADALAHPTFQ